MNENLNRLRQAIRSSTSRTEAEVLSALIEQYALNDSQRKAALEQAISMVLSLRSAGKPALMEIFLAEYGLSTDEGVALMCLAEALLRVPDSATIDRLIEDKLVSSSWHEHVGESPSMLVNTATYGLIVTSKILSKPTQKSIVSLVRESIKRLGVPVVRSAVKRAMKEMGHQFVLGETIDSALVKGAKAEYEGYTYSFDMLGEAAVTSADAEGYFASYKAAIEALANKAITKQIELNPGISIKLSALHPRYDFLQKQRVIQELVPKVIELALLAKRSNLGINIDAEEADRLDISLDVIEAVLTRDELSAWDGFGVVVQAYNKSAAPVIDWLYELAASNQRKIMVRLVKGAYWDNEIKRTQVEGLDHFPVFTQKSRTDVSYLCCAKKLFSMSETIYPQFATHNAHTVASILQIAPKQARYEFQRLHGMGENVYQSLVGGELACRIYAPVGQHKELLAYLVRRLLENGANSSFVNQVVDLNVPVEEVVLDPFEICFDQGEIEIEKASDMFAPKRQNSKGIDLKDYNHQKQFATARKSYRQTKWRATPLLAEPYFGSKPSFIFNPSNSKDLVGEVIDANLDDVATALRCGSSWQESTAEERAKTLNKVASLIEKNVGEISALLGREAGKTPIDIIAEVREAVDFLRYYSAEIQRNEGSEALGIFVCISPWNFPLAIFVGQIAAALAAGNGVIAKPAEATPLVAFYTVKFFHKAGVPRDVLQLLPGDGASIGAQLVSSSRISGVCFTGSTVTGQSINRAMAENMAPSAPLIAETGGLNAMIVDSTALPEQAVQDIIRSAFQSAGQRCSALRILYLQNDIYDQFLEMLFGAMDELKLGDAWNLDTDVGPLISKSAKLDIQAYIQDAANNGSLLKTTKTGVLPDGHYLAPSVISVSGIESLETEVFGPVLHVARFGADDLSQVVTNINQSGYGLTFGLHSRIDKRADQLSQLLNVGNIYINRDQIGAVVESQPFGGENLSGTGPKAGGPNYFQRFTKYQIRQNGSTLPPSPNSIGLDELQALIDSIPLSRTLLSKSRMPGPTGEENILYEYGRGIILCLGPSSDQVKEQQAVALKRGCIPVAVCAEAEGEYAIKGQLPRDLLMALNGVDLVVSWGNASDSSKIRQALAAREGRIVRFVCDDSLASACITERLVCRDTTASGGNVSLLAFGHTQNAASSTQDK